MIKRFSSNSRVFNFRNIDGGCILSWQTPLHFCGSLSMAITAIHISPVTTVNDKLVHVSTNVCQGTLTNPDGYIYTCSSEKLRKSAVPVFQKGLLLYQISLKRTI